MKDYEVVKVEKPEERLNDVNRKLKVNFLTTVYFIQDRLPRSGTPPS